MQGMVGKDTLVPQFAVGKGAKGLFGAAIRCDVSITGRPATADI